ncbi:MAG: tetratricopeptide repeat protein [Pirellulaceae bacterium]
MRIPASNVLLCFIASLVVANVASRNDSFGSGWIQDPQSDSVEKHVTKATGAWSAGRYLEAFESASKVCELKPDDIRFQLLLGDISFAAGKIDESIAAYDAAIRIEPDIEPRLWQRGLALFYAGRFADGVQQFETHQTVNSQDVENAVWHLLCAARVSDVKKAREKLIPINKDSRIPMAEIYEMFAGRMTSEDVLKAAQQTSDRVPEKGNDHKLQLYYAWLYIGLHQEMLGQQAAALESLKKAEELNPLGKTNFMCQVARVHLQLRAESDSLNGDKRESNANAHESNRDGKRK